MRRTEERSRREPSGGPAASARLACRHAAVGLLAAALAILPGALLGDTFRIDTGQVVEGEVLKETEEQVFVDLGFTVIGIPKRRIAHREVAAPEPPGDPAPAEGGGAREGGIAPVAGAGGGEEPIYLERRGQKAPIKRHAEAFGDAVVRITTPSGLGSGFVVHAAEGYIVTNHHVVAREQKISVTFFLRRGTEYQKLSKDKVRIVAFNPFLDLALLRVEDLGDVDLPQVYLSAGEDDLKVGDPVFAIGNPLGLERSVSEGIVSKTDRAFDGILYLQTTAAINPGNSGGPLFNDRGEVVGIINMKASFAEGLGFAIPVSSLKGFLRHRAAFAYDKDNPNAGVRYLKPPRRPEPGAGEKRF